jgi:hypothetical protein
MPAVHAPGGGVTIRGVHYRGGQFIPGEVIHSLTDDEATAAGLKGPSQIDPHPRTAPATHWEQAAVERFGEFAPHVWNQSHEKVIGAAAGKTASQWQDEIESWPEFADHKGRGTSDPHTAAIRERIWKEYVTAEHPRSESLDRARAAAGGEPPKLAEFGMKGRGKSTEWMGRQEYVAKKLDTLRDLRAEYGYAGESAYQEAEKQAWAKPLDDAELSWLDMSVQHVDSHIKKYGVASAEVLAGRPGYLAAEVRLRTMMAEKLVRQQLGEPKEPEQAEMLKALFADHAAYHGENVIRDLYDEMLENDENADPDHDATYEAVRDELTRRTDLLDAAEKEFTEADDDFDPDELVTAYTDAIDENTENPAETAVAKVRANMADPHGRFFEGYHDLPTADERASHFWDAVEAGKVKWDKLTDDEREILADDLASQDAPAESLTAQLDAAVDAAGGLDELPPGAWAVYHAAAKKLPAGGRRAFVPEVHGLKLKKGEKAREYDFYDLSDLDPNGRDYQLAKELARAAGPSWQSADGHKFLIDRTSGAGQELSNVDDLEHVRHDFEDEDGAGFSLMNVFDSLPHDLGTVNEGDVPPAARDFGRVSGGEGVTISPDWNPNDHDIYKPITKDLYILRRGDANPALGDDGDANRYELVHRSKTGMRVGLPPQFWEGVESRSHERGDGVNDDALRRRESLERRRSKPEQSKRAAINAERQKLSDFRREFGRLQDLHNRAVQKQASVEAHQAKADEALHDFQGTYGGGYQWLTEGHPLSETGNALDQAVTDLSDHADTKYEPTEIDLQDVRGLAAEAAQGAEDEGRGEYAKALKTASKTAATEQRDARKRLEQDHKDYDEHFAGLKTHWGNVQRAAVAAIAVNRQYATDRAGEEIDPATDVTTAEARENAKLALRLAKLSKRQLRKLDRMRSRAAT